MKINLLAPINATSYGLSASFFLQSLLAKGEDISLFPIGQPQPAYPQFGEVVQWALKNATTFDKDAISLRFFHQFAMAEHVGKTRVGYTIFELEDLTDAEKHQLGSLDLVISPTKWQEEVIKSQVPNIKTATAPLGVDQTVFTPTAIDIPQKPFTFLMVGKWEERKCHAKVLKAFDNAFGAQDDVEFHVICHFLNPEWQKNVEPIIQQTVGELNLRHKVKIYPPKFIPDPNMLAKVYNLADTFVAVSRGEGWNLCMQEAMACGKNVIASNCTGHTEYIDEDCGILINPIGKIPAKDVQFFDGSRDWYDFSDEEIIEAMRFAYNNWGGKQNDHCIEVAGKYTWEKSADKLLNVLKDSV